MKRVSIVILIFILMTVSFAVVGLVIMYASGTATSVEEAIRLLSGETKAPPSRSDEDGVRLLEIHKSELAAEMGRLKRMNDALKSLNDSLSAAGSRFNGGDTDDARLARTAGVLEAMDKQTGADVLSSLGQELSLKLLSRIPEERAAEFLEAMDDPRIRTGLINAMAKE